MSGQTQSCGCFRLDLIKTSATHKKKLKRLNKQHRRARERQLPGTFNAQHLDCMLQYWGYACAICGNQEGFAWTLALDYWIPLDALHCPGTLPTNILPFCHGEGGCNNSKGSKDPVAWLLARWGKRKAHRKLQDIAHFFAQASTFAESHKDAA